MCFPIHRRPVSHHTTSYEDHSQNRRRNSRQGGSFQQGVEAAHRNANRSRDGTLESLPPSPGEAPSCPDPPRQSPQRHGTYHYQEGAPPPPVSEPYGNRPTRRRDRHAPAPRYVETGPKSFVSVDISQLRLDWRSSGRSANPRKKKHFHTRKR
ncbi:hypothetical protein EJ05DRAFT_351266 [Pseudovirgaria hyperparasitica]|uniref:Uncharacterized protein n=1 Tax=Pseudovirgaria hyperparasitica TaxID=470096 RepID=A0A6A6WBF7_9PEZI|nr:uncharacterized protein EJ05DRAFT_351266 [Pseudovirgaria hyperparasitica]KAF2758441.1 hypothetical protein EJ05DRAFT_351266 [Pseudovirgaria hyperparasitica]